jgi:hypothetical protein
MKLRFGVAAGIFLAIFCLYPQMKMLYLRGDAWNGHYAYNDIDEVAYASYVRALIDGRPRRNDPYSGVDDRPGEPQPESLFSIQFAAPYSVALPARVLGVGAPWAMIVSGAVAGFVAAAAGFWLIFAFTRSNWFALAGSLVTFAGGAVFAGEGAALELFFDGFSYPYFPGFRRYIPAMAMGAVFVLFAAVTVLLTGARGTSAETVDGKPGPGYRGFLVGVAVGAFAFCVFSYFYIWTTAAAWLASVFILWVLFRPEGFRSDLKLLGLVAVGWLAALIPYAFLLSHRSQTMDDVQLLVRTHAPDLWRMPEYVSVVCLLMLAVAAAKRRLGVRDGRFLLALSFALVPLIVFNQQVLTGRSLQPIHYQVFIGNYVAGLALVLTVATLIGLDYSGRKAWVNAAAGIAACIAVAWGLVECHYTVRVLDDANVERDLALPVAKRLEQLARHADEPQRQTVLAFDMIQSDDLPSVAPQNVLWSRHQHVFAGLTWEQNKERYYQYLYYSNVDPEGLDYLLKNDFVSQIALFGWGRHTDRLSFDAKPLTFREIGEEVARYRDYLNNFDRATASSPLISYVVVNDEAGTDISNLERWYELDEGEKVGKYTIFRARLR